MGNLNINLKGHLCLAISMFGAGAAFADSPGYSSDGFWGYEAKRVGIEYLSYAGDENKSLTGNSGYGLEAAISRGNAFLQFLTKIRLEYSTGNSKFLDSTTQLNLDYRLLGVNAGLGFRLNPVISSLSTGFGIYFGAAGMAGMAQLSLPNRTYTTLKSGQSGTILGYDIFAGVEFGSKGTNRPFIEAALKTSGASLGGTTNFRIDGLILQGGLVW